MRKILLRFITVLATLVSLAANAAGPVANVSRSSNLTGTMPLTAKLDGSLSTCPNGCTQSNSYAWDYGDAVPSQPGLVQTHEYDFAGVYTATLTITDNSGLTSKASVTVTVNLPPGESLANYVQACKTQLNFQSIPDNVDCYSGDLFQTAADFDENASVNDYMGYRKITDQVDMAFACRWLFGDPVNNRSSPISIEMLVHNRQNGNTCYFSAKGFISHSNIDPTNHLSKNPSSIITSPTASNASTFWDDPSALNVYVRCVGCHIEGPYIATPTIAPFLAKNGLLNNGHDTGSSITNSDLTSSFNKAHVKYHAVVTPNGTSAFSSWDSLKQSYMDPGTSSCSLGCHVIGTLSPQQDIGQAQRGCCVTILHDPANQLNEIEHAGVMPPYDDGNDYRWINLAIPDAGTESETFANAKSASTTLVPQLLSSCVDPNTNNPGVPNVMEAHVVGSENAFVIAQPGRFAFLPDRLSKFNLKDGLTCLNSDQDPGQTCSNYTVQYECTNNTSFVKSWVNWPAHALSSDGDHEERNGANPCPSGSTATGIQASVTLINGWTYSSVGPNDRLASFSQYGLTCNNADQPDGKCSNYVVRFSSCATPPSTQLSKTLTNQNVPSSGAKQLTAASSSLTKAQGHNNTWNTQQWSIEPVINTEYVRLHNPGSNVYLTVTSTAEQATVGTAASNTTTNEMWLVEPVANSSYVRLKNLFSGRYLTMGDPNSYTSTPDYIPIFSQARNTDWNTQLWLIQ